MGRVKGKGKGGRGSLAKANCSCTNIQPCLCETTRETAHYSIGLDDNKPFS